MRQHLPEWRQGMNGIEDAGQKSERHDQKIQESGELVELVGPNAGDQTKNAENRAAEQREGKRPQRMLEGRQREPERYYEHPKADDEPTDHRPEHVSGKDVQ